MIERMYVPALDFWAAQSLEERKKILTALQADEGLANHDFAGLPPQVWAGIAAGLAPPPPAGAEKVAEDEDADTSKKKRGH